MLGYLSAKALAVERLLPLLVCLLLRLVIRFVHLNEFLIVKKKKKKKVGASLVAQWLGICLPIQEHGFEPWSGRIPHATEQLGP